MRFGKNRQFGFSLVEVMVAMGLLGAGAVAFMQMQKSNIKSNKASEARYDVNNLASEINSVLINEDACSNTFRTILNSSSTNGTFTKIKDSSSSAQDLYTVGQEVEDSIRIAGFSYEMKTPFVDIAGQKKASFRVSFSYQYTNKAVNNPNTYQKNIEQDYVVLLDGSSVFKTCYSDTDSSIENILGQACKSIGGDTSELPTHCRISDPSWNNWWDGVNGNIGGMSFLDLQNVVIPKMKEDFLSLDGSSHMVGTLTTSYVRLGKMVDPFNLPPSDLPEYDYEKHALTKAVAEEITTYCQAGKTGFFKSQTTCTKLVCSDANMYLAGYDGAGEPVCNPLVTESTCDAGGRIMVNPLDGSAKYECCTPTCSGAENYCVGQFFDSTNGCGLCAGTMPNTEGVESYVPTGEYKLIGTCVAGKQKRAQKMKQICVETACSLGCPGPEIKWKEEAVPVSCGEECGPVEVTVNPLDVAETSIKFSWSAPGVTGMSFKAELWSHDFGEMYDNLDLHDNSSGTSGFSGLTPNTIYNLRVGYLCDLTGEWKFAEMSVETKGGICPVPDPVDVIDISETAAVPVWMDYEEHLLDLPPGVEGFEVTYGHEGYNHEAGPFTHVGSKRIGLNGLTPNTRYDVYIRSICVGDERGEWSAKRTFQTLGGGEAYSGLVWECQAGAWINIGEVCSGKSFSCEDTCSDPGMCLVTIEGGTSCCKQKPTGLCQAMAE